MSGILDINTAAAGMDRATGPLTRRVPALLVCVLLLLSSVGCPSDDDGITVTGSDLFTISLAATNVTSSSIHLAITASFNALNTPLWRTDVPGNLARFDLEANTPSFYTDTNVTPGVTYCYMAGGNYFFIGSVISNEECVTPH